MKASTKAIHFLENLTIPQPVGVMHDLLERIRWHQ
jgi:hypothetical protein